MGSMPQSLYIQFVFINYADNWPRLFQKLVAGLAVIKVISHDHDEEFGSKNLEVFLQVTIQYPRLTATQNDREYEHWKT